MTEHKELQIGDQVTEFHLPASSGEQVALSDYRGKRLVIYFYPKNMTPGCTTEACDFRDYTGEFAQNGAEVIGISADSLASHGKFITKHDLPFLLLSDESHQVAEQFGVWQEKSNFGKKYMGIVRSTFLLNEQGVLVKAWRKVKVTGHVQEVLDAVKAL